ncbi:UNVERIFIED_CONTAM: hypothetical protein Slati_2455800 [Sesamum latifolium]|uniref:Reverse transcriptase domain-containing protein n=1 Tax=Sesamum latifolium TaxID=2727402 RepID=A0AAW2WEH0_9LAMI
MHTNCLISVIYGDCDLIRRRDLWAGLCSLAEEIIDDPWCVLGDFNAVIDSSEVCGRAADTSSSMTEFRDCITEAALVHLPFTGCPFSWHNCSEGSRSHWKRLDRVLVNEAWLVIWPQTSYMSALPSTSDHSPLILMGSEGSREQGFFKFDNFLVKQPSFLNAVRRTWRHPIHGTRMYSVKMENNMLQQRAKLNWLKHGDQCSKIFFRKINARRARQRIHQITDSAGVILKDTSQVSIEFVSYYQSLLGGLRQSRELDLSFLQPGLRHILIVDEAIELITPVTAAEIQEALFDISEDSAPGPDGYSSAFFKAAWPEIGGDICAAIMEFFHSGRLLKQINATLLVLIPKVQLPVRVSDYRPIACCNVIYKVVTKILVRRMQRILHLLIDHTQTAFVPGRSISDNVMLAQELLAGYNQVRLPPRCTIKVDIQKAYDSVNWDFILEALRIFNFPPRFIGWIEQCITTVTFSVSLNGSMHGNTHSAHFIKDTLAEFATMSGLHVNPNKSQIILSKAVQTGRQAILDLLGFQEGSLPIKYLGVPLVSSRLTIADCQPLIEKIDNRLAGWSQFNLSLAGRTQLIKLVLSSLHTYWASVFILPKSIINVIEGRIRKFLWQGSNGRGYAKEDEQSIWVQRGLYTVLEMGESSNCGQIYGILGGHCYIVFPRGPTTTGLASDSLLMTVLQQGHWNWPSATDFDIQEIISCLPNIFPQQPDTITWRSSAGKFTTAAAISLLQPPSPQVLWHRLLGGKFKIPRHDFILWLALLG